MEKSANGEFEASRALQGYNVSLCVSNIALNMNVNIHEHTNASLNGNDINE